MGRKGNGLFPVAAHSLGLAANAEGVQLLLPLLHMRAQKVTQDGKNSYQQVFLLSVFVFFSKRAFLGFSAVHSPENG